MSGEPEFLTIEEVLLIHNEQLAAYGGASGIRDQGLLESAVAMPQASFGEAYLHEDSTWQPRMLSTWRKTNRLWMATSALAWSPR